VWVAENLECASFEAYLECAIFGVRLPVGALVFCDLSQPSVRNRLFVKTRSCEAEGGGRRRQVADDQTVTGNRTPKRLPILRRRFRVFEFFLPTPVAALLD
jgi:hypothetical protein